MGHHPAELLAGVMPLLHKKPAPFGTGIYVNRRACNVLAKPVGTRSWHRRLHLIVL